MITDILKKEIPVTRISRAMDIQRSTIYYTGSHGKRLPRISQEIEEQALKIAGEPITYGYRRIWALAKFRHSCEYQDGKKNHEEKQSFTAICKA